MTANATVSKEWVGTHRPDIPLVVYTTYEDPILANQIGRKLGVFDRKLEESTFLFMAILVNIRENETIMFKLCLFD